MAYIDCISCSIENDAFALRVPNTSWGALKVSGSGMLDSVTVMVQCTLANMKFPLS